MRDLTAFPIKILVQRGATAVEILDLLDCIDILTPTYRCENPTQTPYKVWTLTRPSSNLESPGENIISSGICSSHLLLTSEDSSKKVVGSRIIVFPDLSEGRIGQPFPSQVGFRVQPVCNQHRISEDYGNHGNFLPQNYG
jgi:hypothetical protein